MSDKLNGLDRIYKEVLKNNHYFNKTENDEKNSFEKIVKSVFTKNIEFNLTIQNSNEDEMFFLLGGLRGLCEDFIVLKYINVKLETIEDDIITLLLLSGIYKSSIAQWNYLSEKNPDQTIYYKEDFNEKAEEVSKKINEILKLNGVRAKKGSLPSVFDMAKAIDYENFYRYLYHATSKLVHFNPGILFRLGWEKLNKIEFSTKNFVRYYNDFGKFYGAILFLELSNWIHEVGVFKLEISDQLDEIKAIIDEKSRWPEIITFEEMNIGPLSKHLHFSSPSRKAKDEN